MADRFETLTGDESRTAVLEDLRSATDNGHDNVSVASLSSSTLFSGLTDDDYTVLAALGRRMSFDDASVIIREGDPAEALYVLEKGMVIVEKSTVERQEEIIAALEEGECFGELSLIMAGLRSAPVRAMGKVTVITFLHKELQDFFQKSPAAHLRIMINLAQTIAIRLQRSSDIFIHDIYDSVIIVDKDHKILRWSKSKENNYFSPKTAIGADILDAIPGLAQADIETKIESVIKEEKISSVETKHRMGSGEMIYIQSTLTPFVDEGKIKGVAIINKNISELKRLENELIESERLAAVGQMATEIGHEMGNYLTVISGYAYWLKSDIKSGDYDKTFSGAEIIQEHVEKMRRFADGLMDSSKRMTRKNTCSINDLITRSIDFIKFQNTYDFVTFKLALAEDVPPIQIDAFQIQQVLLNLYKNAADASPSCTILTSSRLLRYSKYVEIQVKDDGPGIPQDIKDKIFEAGFTTKEKGHGFGLFVCYRIAKNHDGTMIVDSLAGKGTTFKILLPCGKGQLRTKQLYD